MTIGRLHCPSSNNTHWPSGESMRVIQKLFEEIKSGGKLPSSSGVALRLIDPTRRMRCADAAFYRAKRDGRSRVSDFSIGDSGAQAGK